MNAHQIKQFVNNNFWYGENSHRENRAHYLQGIPFLQRQVVVSLVMPDSTRVWGIDISHWNTPPVNLKRMVELYSLQFVIIKGCDGSINTRYYFEHIAAARDAGIPWGMYNWLYPASKVNMDGQINAWLLRYNMDPPALGMFIDAEWTNYGGAPANPNANDLRQAHDKWKSKSGLVATTYTAPGYANTYLIGFDFLREPLWAASWGGNAPLLPIGAKTHLFWQFSATLNGKLLDPNGNAELDGNYFNGTQEEFNNRYGVVTPPPNGGTMKGVVNAGYTLTVRDSANADTGKRLVAGDVVYGPVTSNRIYFERIYRKDGSIEQTGGNAATVDPANTAVKWMTLTNEAEPTTETVIKLKYDASDNLTGVNVDGDEWVKQ